MNKLYNRHTWKNNQAPALNQSNLNEMEAGIDGLDDRVVALAGAILETIPTLEEDIDDAMALIAALENLNENPPYIGANGNWYIWDTALNQYVDSGVDASISVTIADVTAIAPDATPYVTNTGTPTDPIFHLFIPRGKGIASIQKTSTLGLVDTYTITYSDGYSTTFDVTNGIGVPSGGTTGQVLSKKTGTNYDTEWVTPSTGNVNNAYKKVKVGSTEITASGEDTLELVQGSNVTLTPDASLKKITISASGGGSGDMTKAVYDPNNTVANAGGISSYVSNEIADISASTATFTIASTLENVDSGDTIATLFGKLRKWYNNLKSVAWSGSYDDLSNKPTIPAAQIQSDWNQSSSSSLDFIKNKPDLDSWTSTATVDSSGNVTFTGLNDAYGYSNPCFENKLVSVTAMTKSGSGTNVSLTFTLNGASQGDVCKLRIFK